MSAPTLSAPKRPRRRRADTGGRSESVAGRRSASTIRRSHDDLEPLAAQWQRALDSGERALRAAADTLPAPYLRERRRALTEERRQAAELLIGVARAQGIGRLPWLSPVPMSNRLLGLHTSVEACLFDLDGVLTDSGLLHAVAWGTVLDDLLLRSSGETGWHFIPFDRDADYRSYIEGRSRLEGVHAFLDSRGIRIPEGRGDDPADAETACGLAKRKGEAVARALEREGVTALSGVRRYLEAAGRTGLRRGVVSASANTLPMLQVAGLAPLIETWVDADVISAEGARTPPSPDLLLAACRRLDVLPHLAVTFTHRPAGVAAGRAAGMQVIGVGEGRDEELLRGFGADLVVPSLSALLSRAVAGSQSDGVHVSRTEPAR